MTNALRAGDPTAAQARRGGAHPHLNLRAAAGDRRDGRPLADVGDPRAIAPARTQLLTPRVVAGGRGAGRGFDDRCGAPTPTAFGRWTDPRRGRVPEGAAARFGSTDKTPARRPGGAHRGARWSVRGSDFRVALVQCSRVRGGGRRCACPSSLRQQPHGRGGGLAQPRRRGRGARRLPAARGACSRSRSCRGTLRGRIPALPRGRAAAGRGGLLGVGADRGARRVRRAGGGVQQDVARNSRRGCVELGEERGAAGGGRSRRIGGGVRVQPRPRRGCWRSSCAPRGRRLSPPTGGRASVCGAAGRPARGGAGGRVDLPRSSPRSRSPGARVGARRGAA